MSINFKNTIEAQYERMGEKAVPASEAGSAYLNSFPAEIFIAANSSSSAETPFSQLVYVNESYPTLKTPFSD
jgi:hypothetical protein